MLGYMAIGLAVAAGLVPASFAQDSRVLDRCKSAGTGIEAEERQPHQRPGNNRGIVVEVPTGKVCLNPELVAGEPIYVRGTIVGEGMRIVEVSATPFMPVLASNQGTAGAGTPPDQPASW